ncbi:uncharacterized protein B0H18DRAFT_961847 [Fomitopsis serialis]|uniref:uncharacterized protein n=1 Tax=Fomitopsis serialis TaxID=139415 RepID=UPI002007548A|nr:uncharacterized protein B0H18DRAFT_961847 [Neoantrodia serialis]KAH9911698.1 hypothetical protein B0H18DRAFT_961847 [Neoantrodia serialis]
MAPPDPPPSSTTTGPKAARVITSTVAAASGQHLPHSPRSASGNSSPAPGQTSAAQRARQLSRQGSAEQSVLVGPGVAPNPTPTVVPSTFPETEEDIDFGFGFSADTPKGVEVRLAPPLAQSGKSMADASWQQQDSEMREATPGPLLSYSTTPRPSREPTVEPQLSAPAGSLPEGAEYPAVAPVEVNFTWPHAQTEFSWDEDDAFAAIRRYASGLSSFIRSGSDDFRARVARYTTDEFSANEFDRMASSSWFPAAEACRDVFLAMLEAGGNIVIPRILGAWLKRASSRRCRRAKPNSGVYWRRTCG